MMLTLPDIIGWIGALLILYAYFMVSAGKLKNNSYHFQSANILGAVCLVYHTYYYHAYPSTVINIIWIGIAIYTLAGRKKIKN